MTKGPFVAALTFETEVRTSSGLREVSANAPIAPAFDTAMASSGPVAFPWGASKMGYFRLKSAIRALALGVGIGIARADCAASSPNVPESPNVVPAATLVLMKSRLVR